MSTNYRYRAVPVTVTKSFSFDAAHKLDEYVGKCANLHGHTYRLEVSVKGTPDNTGIVIDFGLIKEIVQRTIISEYDHRYLNDLLPFNTTAENLVVYFYDVIERAVRESSTTLEPLCVERLRLWETPTSYAEVSREEMHSETE